MARVLVTGGAGFIGSHLTERLAERGDDVTVLDDFSTGRRDNMTGLQDNPRVFVLEGTVLDRPLVERLVEESDVVFHLAAAVGVDWVLRHPLRSLETNIQGTEHVLRAASEAEGGRRVLIASTSEVYGKNDKDALSEDDDRVLGSSRLARWFYASAKAIDEALALAYWYDKQLPVTVVRLFNTVGPRQTGRYGMVVPRFVRWALRNEPIRVFGDGEQTRCFTNVHDVVRALIALTETPRAAGEIFNIGQPNEIRIVDLARRVVDLTESRSEISFVPYDAAEAYGERAAGFEDMRRRVPDASKLFEYTGVRCRIDLDATLRQVIDYELVQLQTESQSQTRTRTRTSRPRHRRLAAHARTEMCGICGVVAFDGAPGVIDECLVRGLSEPIAHRGPDDERYYISPDRQVGLGFRRLSIVDLSTGEQPMTNEDGSLWLVFNGEIYNHASHRPGLESAGHRFHSRADSEVILHLYEEYGPACVDHLRGMFAFALWDSRARRLLLARDRIGIKPLYYAAVPGGLVFGSEIKSLFGHPRLSVRLNEAALSLYLTFASVPAPETLFAGVHKLPAGHRLIVDVPSGRQTLERYWQPLPDPDEVAHGRRDAEEYVEQLETRVREAIGLHMMSDVPYGAFLSGGVDSSLNVALMAELADRPVSTFSVAIAGDPASDELDFARQVATRYGTDHHEIVIDDDSFLRYLPDLVWHQDEPLADPVCVPLHAVSEAARENGTKVVQVGEGADELFSGYTSYAFFTDFHRRVWKPYGHLPSLLRKAAGRVAPFALPLDRADVVVRAGADDGELFWGGAIPFYELHLAKLYGHPEPSGRRKVASLYADLDAARPGASQLQRMIGIELRQRLPELLLMRVDKVTMGSSIEARVPYLDHKLIEFALSIPPDVTYRNGVTKWVLKRVAERVGLDRDLIYRRKRGFCGSASNMLGARLLDRAESDILDSPFAAERFDLNFIRQMFAEQRAGRVDHNFRLWNLWNLVAWHACWFESSPRRELATAGTRGR